MSEDWHALIGKSFSENLQGYGLAGAGGACNQTVAVGQLQIEELFFLRRADENLVFVRY